MKVLPPIADVPDVEGSILVVEPGGDGPGKAEGVSNPGIGWTFGTDAGIACWEGDMFAGP